MNSFDSLLDRSGKKLGLNIGYFLASGSWVAARYILLGLLSLLISIGFARLGTPELYGQYQFAIAVVSLLSILSLPGLNTVTLIAVAKGIPRVLIEATRVCFRVSWLASALVAVVGIYYLTTKNQPGVGWSLIGASFLLPFFYGPNGWYTYYEGRRDFRSPTKRIITTNVIIASVLLLGLWKVWSLPALVIGYFLVNAVLTVFFFWEVRKKIGTGAPPPVDVKAGLLYTLQKSSSTLPETVQPIIISSLYGFGTLGIFMIAYALVNSASGLISALSSTYFPLLIQYKKLVHGRIILQNLALGLIIAAVYWIFVTTIFVPLYGGRFIDSFQLARYFSGAVALMPLKLYLASYFTARNAPGLVIRANIVSYAIALAVFLIVATSSITGSFIGYYATLQLVAVLILGIAYYRRLALRKRKE